MLTTLFTKTLVVFAGQTLHLHASDTLDARKLKIGINVRKGGKLIIEGTAQKPVVLLGGRGTVIRASGDISITNARFVGELPPGCTTFAALNGNGIEVRQSVANISGTTFLNFENAVLLKGVPPTRTYQTLQGNTFLQNEAGIEVALPSGSLDLNLSCNAFDPGTSLIPPYNRTLTGLVDGINVVSGSVNKIGIASGANAPYLPGANVFPVLNRTVAYSLWQSPSSNWRSIRNAGTTTLTYSKYVNEYLGNRTVPTVNLSTPSSGQSKATLDPAIAAADPANFALVCQTSGFEDNFFPFFRRGMDDNDPTGLMAALNSGKLDYLLQSAPNPASGKVMIGFAINSGHKQAALELFELATGRVLERRALLLNSPRMQAFSTQGMASGLYGYRLLVDGRQADAKKMIIAR